jgi:hypothetical protein
MTKVPLSEIMEMVNEMHELDARDKARKREFVEARYVFTKLALELTYESSTAIGKEFHQDHSAVLYYKNNRIYNEGYFTELCETRFSLLKEQILEKYEPVVKTLRKKITKYGKDAVIVRQQEKIKALQAIIIKQNNRLTYKNKTIVSLKDKNSSLKAELIKISNIAKKFLDL